VCWDLGADASRVPEWQEGVLEVKDITGKLDQVGAGYSTVLRIMGRRLEGRFEVSKVDKPRLVELSGTAPGGGRAKSTVWLEPAGGGTDLTVEIDYELPGGLISDVADKVFMERAVERQIRHSNENFKALCEAKIPAHA
jgi:carbon monoxide dehydrogenase subunit G